MNNPDGIDVDIWEEAARGLKKLDADECFLSVENRWSVYCVIAQALQAERDRDPWNYNMGEAPTDRSAVLMKHEGSNDFVVVEYCPFHLGWIGDAGGLQPTSAFDAFQLIKSPKGELM